MCTFASGACLEIASMRGGTAAPAPQHDPRPEVPTLRSPSCGLPGAANEREVQQQHGVCGCQSRSERVVRSEIAVHDPALPRRQLPLNVGPFLGRHRRQFGSPEVAVKFENRQAKQRTELLSGR